ncbi:MAG: hypothetical protein M3R48_00095 [Candidatus Dormibacteraeota bacterium]|nr:hypothetical protein [Candidatus Dormibacteraeota bacterium]
MISEPEPNTISRPYRGVSVQEVDVPLRPDELVSFLLGREVYRRTTYLVLRHAEDTALVEVRKASEIPLFSRVIEARVLSGPEATVFIREPDVDVGNATALGRAAARHARHGRSAYVVLGRFEHINFIWKPQPVEVAVTEVVPPEPPKLLAQAEQVVAFDEDLPPIELKLEAVDLHEIAVRHPAPRYLLPCRGCGIDLPTPVEFLDTRPAIRHDWLMIGCERSLQFHRHFYGDDPARVDICPRKREHPAGSTLRLVKCCLLERGVEMDGSTAVVPWGASLDEVRLALRRLTGVDAPALAEQAV